jgi:hypothetical protein
MLLPRWREPAYGGKKVSKWFDEAANMTSEERYRSEAWQAFEMMEGDAVPFLVRCLRARPSLLENLYADLQPKLPRAVRQFLPRPRIYLYASRRICALELLGHIGIGQRMKAAEGAPSKKPSVALALPAMKALLESGDKNDRVFTAQAASYIGPLAAPLVPQLTDLVQTPDAGVAAVQALGVIGPPASNAVEALIQWATNTPSHNPVLAVQSLGGIGPAARSAVPLVTLMLTNRVLPFAAARALAEIGVVPDEAVPTLLSMKGGTNSLERSAATLAMWRRDQSDPDLRAQVVESLHSSNRGAVLLSLARMGTNAAVFLPEVRRMVDDSFEGRFARRVLRQIQPSAE